MNKQTQNILIGVAIGYLAAKMIKPGTIGYIPHVPFTKEWNFPTTAVAGIGRGWNTETWPAMPPKTYTRIKYTV